MKNYTGLPLFFQKFVQVFQISSRFLKLHISGFIFNLKLSLRLKPMLNSVKTLKRYCKAILNLSFKKKNFDDDKYFIYMINLLFQIKILLLNM